MLQQRICCKAGEELPALGFVALRPQAQASSSREQRHLVCKAPELPWALDDALFHRQHGVAFVDERLPPAQVAFPLLGKTVPFPAVVLDIELVLGPQQVGNAAALAGDLLPKRPQLNRRVHLEARQPKASQTAREPQLHRQLGLLGRMRAFPHVLQRPSRFLDAVERPLRRQVGDGLQRAERWRVDDRPAFRKCIRRAQLIAELY